MEAGVTELSDGAVGKEEVYVVEQMDHVLGMGSTACKGWDVAIPQEAVDQRTPCNTRQMLGRGPIVKVTAIDALPL